MVDNQPSVSVKRLEAEVNMVLRRIEIHELGEKPRRTLAGLRQSLADSIVYIRAYELSEIREEQLQNAKTAREWLAQARQNILKASEYDIFGAVDVAQLTAHIDRLSGSLK
jgi:hypothetical protein